jgi:hypothetical protein
MVGADKTIKEAKKKSTDEEDEKQKPMNIETN